MEDIRFIPDTIEVTGIPHFEPGTEQYFPRRETNQVLKTNRDRIMNMQDHGHAEHPGG
jgi:hypothetical protein